jgi:hypothetical protein
LAREGSANTFTGPEPVIWITKTTTHRSISVWIKLQHQIHWSSTEQANDGHWLLMFCDWAEHKLG